jgi:hypothetical protein
MAQRKVFEFVGAWMFAHDLGLTPSECHLYAWDKTNCSRIVAARARNLIRNAGFAV